LRWAVVIGIDEYGGQEPQLESAVADAEAFRDWVVAKHGGNVQCDRVYTLMGRRSDDAASGSNERLPTKDNVLGVINELMAESDGRGEALYFFFSGHGVTTTYANREESALVFPGIDDRHPVQTLAVRSITEFFETTRFEDQFFFLDACRSPLERSNAEVGAWTIPRRREPGQDPVQQFVLYATSPGRPAESALWAEQLSAFTRVLVDGLEGRGRAKAWSWERNCYEVRWERLASYVKAVMEGKRTNQESDPPESGWPFQIPQDVGIRGVAGRDRDALLSRPRGSAAERYELTLELDADSEQKADVTVLDAIGGAVASALGVTGGSQKFTLPPRTYAARAIGPEGRVGRLPVPVELYDDSTRHIEWLEPGETPRKDDLYTDGTIEIRSRDPLAVADVRDETGWVVGVATKKRACQAPPGFYRVRQVGPERAATVNERALVLRGGTEEHVELPAPAADTHAVSLADALGGGGSDGYVIPAAGAEPATWVQPSTVVTAAIGAALHGDRAALDGLGLTEPPAVPDGGSGVALFAVSGSDETKSLDGVQVRVWPAGDPVPEGAKALESTDAGVVRVVDVVAAPEPYWLSIEPPGAAPTVVALPLLKGSLATVVAQVDTATVRLYQFRPLVRAADTSTPDWMRRLEHLQRQLLGGRLDGADQLAKEITAQAEKDPFAGCLAGYVLLRLGFREGLGELASTIIEAAPTLSDAYILRGEYEAYVRNDPAANQAFAEAVSAGIPAFGEGLTRLVEGLRVSGFNHPRGSLVRYIFQRHARGSMWAAFTPRRKLEPGRLVITGADIGFEG
jgi:Caspase domain